MFIGVSSYGDCPLVEGNLFKLDAATGTVLDVFHAAPPGCVGDGIWGSPALDSAAGTIYVATGNPGECPSTEAYGDSVVELRASDLSVVGSWNVPAAQQAFDSDFGSTPTLFSYRTASGARVKMAAW